MKISIKLALATLLFGSALTSQAQGNRTLQFDRPIGKDGLNIFEPSKEDTIPFNGLKVRVGGDFAMQFQALSHENDLNNLVELSNNFNLPSANLNLDVQLADGVKMHLRTYLSSRHHQESWVKGGNIQIDKLDFIKPGFMEGLMKVATLRIGLDEFNYGDAHFRRSDNAMGIYNPFIGNYIMDAFSTEAFGELTLQHNGMLAVLGITNGKVNQSVVVNGNSDNQVSFYGKLGYDNQFTDDFRFRLTGSWYINKGTTTGVNLYGGDRAGGRYYNVMDVEGQDSYPFSGRFNPKFKQLTAVQINPFVKLGGMEFFGIYELAQNSKDQGNGAFAQLAGELIYRFGGSDQLYVGGRYNMVSGEMTEGAPTQKINRFNVGGGWFLTKNILTKLEYVMQKYEGDGWNGSEFQGGKFNGFDIEAVIGF